MLTTFHSAPVPDAAARCRFIVSSRSVLISPKAMKNRGIFLLSVRLAIISPDGSYFTSLPSRLMALPMLNEGDMQC